MKYNQIIEQDFGNGPGCRVTLFVSGCTHQCKGCFNPESWNPDYGEEFTDDTIDTIIQLLDNDFIDGLSLVGGDPLYNGNLDMIYKLILKVKEVFHNEKTIWLWTGYIYEDIQDKYEFYKILKEITVLVDGPFIAELKDLTLKFRGSSNQRIIYMQPTLQYKTIITEDNLDLTSIQNDDIILVE